MMVRLIPCQFEIVNSGKTYPSSLPCNCGSSSQRKVDPFRLSSPQ